MTELQILAAYGAVLLALAFGNVPLMVGQQGLSYLFGPRDQQRPIGSIAGRIDRALLNSIYGMAAFAPAVLAITVSGLSSNWTWLLTCVYVLARILYIAIYAAGIPVVRSVLWSACVIANFALYLPVIMM